MESSLEMKKDLDVLAKDIAFGMPTDLAEFLDNKGGACGVIGENYVNLYSAAEILKYNEDYAVAEFLPGYLLIGTVNDEALVIDENSAYFIVPFVGMFEKNCTKVAENLESLFEKCEEEEFF